jgi:hypothetical protein
MAGGGGGGGGGDLVKSCRPKISAIFETSDIRVGEIRIDVESSEKLVRCSERSGDQPIQDRRLSGAQACHWMKLCYA